MDSTAVIIVVFLLLAVAIGGLIYNLYWVRRLRQRFSSAFASLDSKQDLAQTITDYFAELGATSDKLDNLQKSYEHLADIGARSIQKTSVVRFNPFRNTGGDQSFVLGLLDNNDSGFLLTSIHSREGTRIYIKAIEYGNSPHALSAEEKQALATARRTKTKEENDEQK
jgi:hypothetical protein